MALSIDLFFCCFHCLREFLPDSAEHFITQKTSASTNDWVDCQRTSRRPHFHRSSRIIYAEYKCINAMKTQQQKRIKKQHLTTYPRPRVLVSPTNPPHQPPNISSDSQPPAYSAHPSSSFTDPEKRFVCQRFEVWLEVEKVKRRA